MMAEVGAGSAAIPESPNQSSSAQANDQEQQKAAQLIQRNYRGYRERRQLEGIGLDASARWAEVQPPNLPSCHSSELTVP